MFFCDLLTALKVPHTDAYSAKRFMSMPFMSMFGLTSLLREYGVGSQGVALSDKTQVAKLPTPFVAPVKAREWVIVTRAADGRVDYLTQGQLEHADTQTFADGWTGEALLLKADSKSSEPEYCRHRLAEIMREVRDIGIWVCVVALGLYLFVANGLWQNGWAYVAVALNIIGLTVSYMLCQKTVGIHTRAADKVCSAIQAGGCDTVINTGGTFLGIFHWAEVGLAYFSVSLVTLLAFPQALDWLALINVLCLPYTVWSVSYQHFKAHAWCTLCLTVQATLWLLFFTYMWSFWWRTIHWSATPFVMVACYVAVCLALNKLIAVFNQNSRNNDSSNSVN